MARAAHVEHEALRELREVCDRWAPNLGEGTRLRGAFLETRNICSRILEHREDPEENEDNPRPGPRLVAGGR